MTLSPEEIEEVKTRAAGELAERLYAEILKVHGTLGAAILLPVSTAAALLGVSPSHARTLLPVVTLGTRAMQRVRWADLIHAIEARTTKP